MDALCDWGLRWTKSWNGQRIYFSEEDHFLYILISLYLVSLLLFLWFLGRANFCYTPGVYSTQNSTQTQETSDHHPEGRLNMANIFGDLFFWVIKMGCLYFKVYGFQITWFWAAECVLYLLILHYTEDRKRYQSKIHYQQFDKPQKIILKILCVFCRYQSQVHFLIK